MNEPLDRVLTFIKAIYTALALVVLIGIASYYFYTFPAAVVQASDTTTSKTWRPKSIQTDLPDGDKGELVKYGHAIITNTSLFIGPLANDEKKKYSGNNLSCKNCHLQSGKKIGSGSFVGVAARFPQFRGRENKTGTLEERINGCMERSMNGKPMPEDSKEMKAMIAYMAWLSEGIPEDMQQLYKGYVPIEIPQSQADTLIGKALYQANCKICHGENGQGTLIPGDTFKGYLYPPLGGDDTFNDGAGMNRVITAAQFIKANMPFGATYDAPLLSDEEAYHIAAYINTFERPSKPNKKADFPDLKLKPVSTPYGPWADSFPAEQHKYGPFQPIIAYYKKEYDLTKNK